MLRYLFEEAAALVAVCAFLAMIAMWDQIIQQALR